MFDEGQLFIIFESEFGGEDLEKAKVATPAKAKSVLHQVRMDVSAKRGG